MARRGDVLLVVAATAALVGCGAGPSSRAMLSGETHTPSSLTTPSYGTTTPLRSVGPVVTTSSTPTRASTPTPHQTSRSSGAPLVVTEADSGSSVHLHKGQYLEVRLAPDGGSWDPPVSHNDAVLHRVSSSGGYPDSTTAVASFVARAAGRTDVTSTTDFACLHTQPRCLPPQRGFDLTVLVS